MKTGLIIFVKNLRYGQVKSRLAAKLGNERAFEIYKKLLHHTCEITKSINADKFLFYSENIERDNWPSDFVRKVQKGNDLGERMRNSFEQLFNQAYCKLVIIGSDCLELNTVIIEESFRELDKTDIVIGPAKDGGYYLLGLTSNIPFLFENIEWSTAKVLDQTISICKQHNKRYALLTELNDIDEAEDWLHANQVLDGKQENHFRL